jgi:hypothetical protein
MTVKGRARLQQRAPSLKTGDPSTSQCLRNIRLMLETSEISPKRPLHFSAIASRQAQRTRVMSVVPEIMPSGVGVVTDADAQLGLNMMPIGRSPIDAASIQAHLERQACFAGDRAAPHKQHSVTSQQSATRADPGRTPHRSIPRTQHKPSASADLANMVATTHAAASAGLLAQLLAEGAPQSPDMRTAPAALCVMLQACNCWTAGGQP